VANFLQLNMAGCVVLTLTVPVRAPAAAECFDLFKIMLRHANAHAYVNAGFAATLSPAGVLVAPPTLVFGGVGSTVLFAP
jgi:hypothetical protein